MPNTRLFQQSFAGGEMSPEMVGRITDTRYRSGATRLRNFIAMPNGTARKRPGFQFVRAVKDSARATRVVSFTYSVTETMVIEVGHQYLRFHTDGATLGPGTPAAWSAVTNYVVGDLVSSGGVNYYCILAHINQAPPNATYWYPMPSGIYEIPTPYVEADLFEITFSQTGDVMTFYHTDYTQRELRREGATRWILSTIAGYGAWASAPSISGVTATRGDANTVTTVVAFAPGQFRTAVNHNYISNDYVYCSGFQGITGLPDGDYIVDLTPATNEFTLRTMSDGAVVNVVAAPGYVANSGRVQTASLSATISNSYVVTAINSEGRETAASTPSSVSNNLSTPGAYNTISWGAVSGSSRYRVYKQQNGLYGFIGETEGTSFRDENISPDLGVTPPRFDTVLGTSPGPGCGAHYDQRRALSGVASLPQSVWLTRVGSDLELSAHRPVLDTDRIYFRLDTLQACAVRHVVPLNHLVLLTNSTEFVVTPVNQDTLTPNSFRARAVSYIGSSLVRPVVVNNTVIYNAARGGHVRVMGLRSQEQGYDNQDLSLRATHLFDDYTLVDSAYSKAPVPIVWFVSSNGKLLGLTYAPEEEVAGWHWHDTDGLFESCAVVAEDNEDRLYVVVKRNINGNDVRYVERLGALTPVAALADAFYVDAGLTYSGASTATITGLSHLEGEEVDVLSAGVVQMRTDVASGQISLSSATTKAHIGLPYTAEIQSLPVGVQIDAVGQGRTKSPVRCWLRVIKSGRFEVAYFDPDENDAAVAFGEDSFTNEITQDTMVTTEVDVQIPADWTDGGQIWIRQTQPTPLTVASLVTEVSIGG